MISNSKVNPGIFIITIILLFPMTLYARSVGTMSDLSGGHGGNQFVVLSENNAVIHTITVRSGKYIDSIQLTFRNGNKIIQSEQYGGNGGIESSFKLKNGEYITEVYGRSGRFIDSLTIFTNEGRRKQWGGNGGGNSYKFSIANNERIIGFWGRSGNLVDAIGVVKYIPQYQGNNVSIAQNKLSQLVSSTDHSDNKTSTYDIDEGKADTVRMLIFPTSPAPNETKEQIYKWMDDYNQELKRIINQLAGSDPALAKFWQNEPHYCQSNRYCRMSYRREAIAYITGVNQ